MISADNNYPGLTRYGHWLVGLGLLTLAAFGLRTISNSDFWLSLACGRWMAAHGLPHVDPFSLTRAQAPWLNIQWLYDWLIYWLWSHGGAVLVTLTHVAIIVVTFLLLVRMARKLGGPIAITLALLVSAWLLAPAFVISPRVLTLLFPALFMFCLATCRRHGWPWLVLLPTQILWTNMFHTFRLGPIICLCFAVQQFTRWQRSRHGDVEADESAVTRGTWINSLLLAAGTLLVTLINPYGWELHRAVMGVGLGVVGPRVTEETSVISHLFNAVGTSQLIWVAAVINIMGLLAEKQRLPLGSTLLAMLGTGLAMVSSHYALLMAVLSFPFFVLSFRAVGLFLHDAFSDLLEGRAVLSGRVIIICLLVIPLWMLGRIVTNHYYYTTGSVSNFGLGVSDEIYPAAAVQVVTRRDFPAVTVNDPLDGGYLLWHAPQRPVFIDARLTVYGLPLLQLVSRGLAGDMQSWQMLERQLAPGAVLLNCCHPQAMLGLRNLLATGRWAINYFDGVTVILLRTTPENSTLLQDPQIQALGLRTLDLAQRTYERHIAAHWFPAHSPALIGAGIVLMALGQYSEAEKVYSLLTRGTPNMPDAWLELGICRWHQQHPREALTALQRAIADAPRNAQAWLWCGQVCEQLGLTQEAQAAWRRAEKLNPGLKAAFVNQLSDASHAAPRPRARK